TFDSQTKVNAPSDDKGGNNGSNGSGNGQGNDTPTDDKSKIEALLAEINEKLKELEKAVLMALKGVESEKLKGMQLSGDILAKLTDLNGILTKPDQTKEIVTTYAPQYQVASNSLMNYQMQLMSMGQMQLPIQPLPNGMYAIPGNLLGFMAMANPEMYGAPFANFMGLDPSMFSKMYAQMRPMHLVKVTVTPTIDGVPFKFEVDINLADAHSEDKVAMLKQNINEHIEEFMRQGATQVNVIKADLMAYIDRIARGSQVLDVSLENLATKEKQVLQSNDGNEPEEEKDEKKVDPTVKSSTPVKKEGTKEHAPKPRFDFVIKDKTITITENGKEVISKVIDKALTPAEEAYIRGELNEIQRAEFKNAEEEQFFFNAMFDKLLEGTKTKTQQQNPAQEQGLEGGM
ncbi:MAG: hypothetical protein IJW28_04755, partial [Clostridia bacterium]|nr:hypothetical protein [Clostridia bacterium]